MTTEVPDGGALEFDAGRYGCAGGAVVYFRFENGLITRIEECAWLYLAETSVAARVHAGRTLSCPTVTPGPRSWADC
ncbi:hypothetical protein [Lentzea sp. E54]|uniref:hypothetical protein n=1 Tax=Lentzea xerophila TaxID=3435883 RepID=UPI003DA4759E